MKHLLILLLLILPVLSYSQDLTLEANILERKEGPNVMRMEGNFILVHNRDSMWIHTITGKAVYKYDLVFELEFETFTNYRTTNHLVPQFDVYYKNDPVTGEKFIDYIIMHMFTGVRYRFRNNFKKT